MAITSYVLDADGVTWLSRNGLPGITAPVVEPPPTWPDMTGVTATRPAMPFPLLGDEGSFDPTTYNWEANTGRSDRNAPLTIRDTTLQLGSTPRSHYHFLPGAEALTSSTIDSQLSESLLNSSARVWEKATGRCIVTHCDFESVNGNALTGMAFISRYNRVHSFNDGLTPDNGLVHPSLCEYSWFNGPGYVIWSAMAGTSPFAYTTDPATDEIIAPGHNFASGQRVYFPSATPFPAPIRWREMFYVHSMNGDRFKIQAGTKSGASGGLGNNYVDLLEAGSGMVQQGAADGNHMDGMQWWQDGYAVIRRNKIGGYPNAAIIIKSDQTASDETNKCISNIWIYENLFPTAGVAQIMIYVRAGSLDMQSVSTRSRPMYISVFDNWFERGKTTLNSGTNSGDFAIFVASEEARDLAVSAQIADPEVIFQHRWNLGWKWDMLDARSWIVWHGNRYTDDGSIIAPPRAYYDPSTEPVVL